MQYFLQRELNRLLDKSFLESFTKEDYEEINDTYGHIITELISERIADEDVIENFTHIIKDIVIQALLKDILPGSTLVILVGFGQNEMYPTIGELKIEGRVNRKLKYSYTLNKMTITDVITSDIYSFAHSKLPIKRFINSIDDRLEEYFFHEVHKQLHVAYQHIIESLADEVEAMEEFKQLLAQTFTHLSEGIKEDFERVKKETSLQPIVENINNLSLEQLAYHAEKLLHLADFKRNMNHSDDRPLNMSINVAIIDKVDGFTLVK